MSRKMLINASEPEEIRVAIVEGSILEEFYVERMSVQSVLGNIFKGRVTNVEPSIGAAFVDFGGSRHGFLHVSDVMEEPQIVPDAKPAAKSGGRRARSKPAKESTDSENQDESAESIEDLFSADLVGEPELTQVGGDDPEVEPGDGDGVDRDVSPDSGPDVGDNLPGDSDDGSGSADAPGFEDDSPDDDSPYDSRQDSMELPADDGQAESADGEQAEVEAGAAPEPPRFRSRRGRGKKTASKQPPQSSAPKQTAPERLPEKKPKLRQIQDLLKKGQEVIVQVTKDGIGTKGPTLTTYLSLPGRYLVLMPGLTRKGVSRKIEDANERDRLKKVLAQLDVREGLGFIVRTAGVGHTKAALQKDYRYLTKLWDEVEKKASTGSTPKTLYRESDLVIRTIRDVYGPEMGDIIIDDEDVARRAREFLGTVMPRAVDRIKLYNGERPLFNAYGIEEEIGQLFMHRVELPSGGSLVVEQTEALVAIDVNSGRFRDEDDLEETAYKINIEAAAAIARQLGLRDLGGVIVVDFIDMRSEKRRKGVERAFREALKDDRARIKVARMSPFGVIEMTRQRVRASLRQSIFQRCPNCLGAGYVGTPETLELNLIRRIKLMLARRNNGVEVYLNHENAEFLMNEKRADLLTLEKEHDKQVTLRIEAELRGDEFRVLPIESKSGGRK